MLTPTKATLTDDQLARIDISALSSGNKLKLRNTITIGESGKAACWNGHEFEACTIRVKAYPNAIDLELPELPRIRHPREYAMDVYYPIDPRIIESDVAGAIRAYSNDTNDGWLFAHTDEGTHHDYELQLLAATDGVFQPFFRQLQVDAFSAAESVRTNAQRQMAVLSAFYGQVVVEARNIARGTFLGRARASGAPARRMARPGHLVGCRGRQGEVDGNP